MNDNKYTLGGRALYLHDLLTKVNMDFVHDVNYKGIVLPDKSIETGKPGRTEGIRRMENDLRGLVETAAACAGKLVSTLIIIFRRRVSPGTAHGIRRWQRKETDRYRWQYRVNGRSPRPGTAPIYM